jgi:L-fuconate dehydratase
VMADFAGFWRGLADESQLRWIGPHKGAVHMALASISGALVDAWCRVLGKPLWQVLVEMSPDELFRWVDLRYLEDFLRPDEALARLRESRLAQPQADQLLNAGYPAYNTAVGWFQYEQQQLLENCRRAVDSGFGAVKLKVGSDDVQDDVARIRAVRDAVGPDIRLMTDANQRWNVQEAVVAGRALRELDCYWLEEPTHPDDVLGYQRIAREVSPLPLASGECVSNGVLFKNLIAGQGIHFVQADVVRLGGLPEWLAVALMAAKAGLPLVPHAGDMGQIHQHLVLWQALSLSREPTYLEYIPHLREHFETPAEVRDGRYLPPQGAGASTRLIGVQP